MLTPRQEEILQFLMRYQAQHRHAPTLVEIQQHCGFKSRSSVQEQLTVIERAGYIQRIPNATRAIKLLKEPETDPEYRLPLLGKVAAGKPVELQYADETVCVPADLYQPHRYALVVKGDSMIEAGILDQDVVKSLLYIIRGQRVISLLKNLFRANLPLKITGDFEGVFRWQGVFQQAANPPEKMLKSKLDGLLEKVLFAFDMKTT